MKLKDFCANSSCNLTFYNDPDTTIAWGPHTKGHACLCILNTVHDTKEKDINAHVLIIPDNFETKTYMHAWCNYYSTG